MMVAMITVLVSICVPCLSSILSIYGFVCNSKRWRLYITLFALSMGMLAYAYIPADMSDLGRYQSWIKYYDRDLFQIFNGSNGLYLRDILFWLVAKSGRINLLQAIPTALLYGVSAYITCSYCEENDRLHEAKKILALQFMLFPLISIINNVRNVSAFALLIMALYRDMVQKKRNLLTILLYLMPCFMHTSAISIILLRILVLLIKNMWILGGIVVLFPALLYIAYANLQFFSFFPVLQNAISLGMGYFLGSDELSSWAKQVANSPWQKSYAFVFLLYLLVCAIGLLIIWRKKHDLSNKETVVGRFIYSVCLFAIVSNFAVVPQFWRYGLIVTSFLAVILLELRKQNGKYTRIINQIIPIVAIGCIALWIYRLPSEINISQWIVNFVISCPLTVMIGII